MVGCGRAIAADDLKWLADFEAVAQAAEHVQYPGVHWPNLIGMVIAQQPIDVAHHLADVVAVGPIDLAQALAGMLVV